MHTKKRILFSITSLRGGGAEKVLVDILKRFDFDRFEVDLCLFFPMGHYLDQVPGQVKIYSFMSKNKLVTRILFKIFFDWPQKYNLRLLSRWYNNLILKNNYNTEVAFMEGLSTYNIAMHKTSAKKIAWVHTDLFINHYTGNCFVNKAEEQKCYSLFNELIFVSSDTLQAFKKEFENVITTRKVINNLIPTSEIQLKADDLNIVKSKFTIVSAGRLEGQKCFDRLIIVAALLKKENYDFEVWLVGTGGLENQLKDLATELGVSDYIVFKGFQSNPYPYIKNADVYVNTSMAEGYPLTVCEALALGKPAVCTRTSGSVELLDDNKYGILVEHDDNSIFEGLRMLIDDASLRSFYSEKAYERSRIFNEGIVKDQIYSVL